MKDGSAADAGESLGRKWKARRGRIKADGLHRHLAVAEALGGPRDAEFVLTDREAVFGCRATMRGDDFDLELRLDSHGPAYPLIAEGIARRWRWAKPISPAIMNGTVLGGPIRIAAYLSVTAIIVVCIAFGLWIELFTNVVTAAAFYVIGSRAED